MEITGKIIQVLPPVSGTSKAGNVWKKREYVLETQETYPKKVFFDFFGDRADQYPLEGGQTIRLSFGTQVSVDGKPSISTVTMPSSLSTTTIRLSTSRRLR